MRNRVDRFTRVDAVFDGVELTVYVDPTLAHCINGEKSKSFDVDIIKDFHVRSEKLQRLFGQQ